MPSSSDQTRVGRTRTLGGGPESSLEGRDIDLSVSPKDIRTSPYDLCANRSDRRQSRGGPMVRIHFPPAESPSPLPELLSSVENPAFRAAVRGWLGDGVGRD